MLHSRCPPLYRSTSSKANDLLRNHLKRKSTFKLKNGFWKLNGYFMVGAALLHNQCKVKCKKEIHW